MSQGAKLNFDAGFKEDLNSGFCDVVLRDDKGRVIL
jgi:hypothetical protein